MTGTILEDKGRVKCLPPLTPAMREVAKLLSEGLSPPKIAKKLGVSQTTVKYHIRQAGFRIPGRDEPRFKLKCWYRRAPMYVLNPRVKGNPLRALDLG